MGRCRTAALLTRSPSDRPRHGVPARGLLLPDLRRDLANGPPPSPVTTWAGQRSARELGLGSCSFGAGRQPTCSHGLRVPHRRKLR